jgi:secondary thiamine-phosphate synthase enzyme
MGQKSGNFAQESLTVVTRGRGIYPLTGEIARLVQATAYQRGLCNLFLQHTSASLMVCENADPDVMRDLELFMSDLVRDGDARFKHTAEGPDDMPAHIRTILTQVSLTLPIRNGVCQLGNWQGVYLWEHRLRSHRREILVTISGE